jgi:hypothetical protein
VFVDHFQAIAALNGKVEELLNGHERVSRRWVMHGAMIDSSKGLLI